jgi:uroporphyrinogen decarboxylase
VTNTLQRQKHDRVPVDLGATSVTTLTRGVLGPLQDHLGMERREDRELMSKSFQTVNVPEEILERFQVDFRGIAPGKPDKDQGRQLDGGRWNDEWSITYAPAAGGMYHDIVESPLQSAGVDDLDSFPWPDASDPGRTRGLGERARSMYENTGYAIVGNMTGSQIFERSWYLRGFEQFLMDLHIDKSFAHRLLRKVTDIQMERTERFLREVGLYIQVFKTSDDLSGQDRPLISPKTYREMIMPYHRELFGLVKERTDAKVLLHCCGNLRPLLGDLIEAGVDIIHPFQYSSPEMEPGSLKQEFGDSVLFWGGIDVQKALPVYSAGEIREATRGIISTMSGAGFVLSPTHNIQPDTPAENIAAMYDTAAGTTG